MYERTQPKASIMNKFERKKPLVSIVIPSWFEKNQDGKYGKNETFILAQHCLRKLIENTDKEKIELIIIDNGSTLGLEETDEHTSTEAYWLTADILIRNSENLGFGPAVNQGIALARGEYIVQMNNDIICLPKWLDAILETFEHKELDPPVGMVMPNLIKKEYQKDCLNEKGRLDIYKVLDLKLEDLVLRNAGIYEKHAQFGSLWCIKKELADKLIEQDGFFFDPQFLCGFQEDRDIYQRIYKMNYETWRTNNTRVGHVGNLTISKIEDKRQYTDTNREKFKKKWNVK